MLRSGVAFLAKSAIDGLKRVMAKVSVPLVLSLILLSSASPVAFASEADLAIPDLTAGTFDTLGGISAWNLLFYGSFVICFTLGISLYLRGEIHKLPAHSSMPSVKQMTNDP